MVFSIMFVQQYFFSGTRLVVFLLNLFNTHRGINSGALNGIGIRIE